MDLKFDDIIIDDKEKPFKNCKLQRERYASILESILTVGSAGCVLSLNGEWGTGKTTFVRMWEQQLKNHGFQTLYFNAWETDFVSDPIVALIGLLKTIDTKAKVEEKFKNLLTCAGKLFCKISPALIKGLLKNHVGEEVLDVITSATEGSADIFQSEIEKFQEECNSIKKFKEALADFVDSLGSDKPLVFFVDELDRCNPHFAVKVLERIKHLFTIPKIVFVLSVDKEQLCNSIRGYYGSDNINAEEYLRRFVDVEYSLPQPNYQAFIDYLYSRLDYITFVKKYAAARNESYKTYEDLIQELLKKLFETKSLTLRQMEKFMCHARLAVQTIPIQSNIDAQLIMFLLFIRQYDSDLYQRIWKKALDVQELVNKLEDILPSGLYSSTQPYDDFSSHTMVYLVAELLSAYVLRDRMITNNDELYAVSEKEDEISLNFKTQAPVSKMIEAIDWYCRKSHRRVSLDRYFEFLELLRELQGDV